MARKNPFERFIPNPIDVAASPHPHEGGFPLPPSVRPGEFLDPTLIDQLPVELRDRIGRSVRGRAGRFLPVPFLAGLIPIVIVPSQPTRFYLIVINNSAANRLFLGFDYDPNANNGIILEANLGFYEPWIVPTNAIHITAAAAGTPGIALIATSENQ